MRHLAAGVILAVAGFVMLGSAILHAMVNVPHLHEDLREVGVRPTLVAAVMLVLYFSVVAMFAFGSLVMSSAVKSLRGRDLQRMPLWIVAAIYVGFGLVAFAQVSPTPHTLGYAGMGALVAVGAGLSFSQARVKFQHFL
jgi:hypothetical protein